jgi:hypothetical protein
MVIISLLRLYNICFFHRPNTPFQYNIATKKITPIHAIFATTPAFSKSLLEKYPEE